MTRNRGGRPLSALVVALISLAVFLVTSAPAAAAGPRAKVKFTSPVCVSDLDVSVTGTVDWKSGPVGTVSVNWGDGDIEPSSFPDWHEYGTAGNYTITLTATNVDGTGTAKSNVTVGQGDATCLYSVSPQPIAETGTLGGGQTTQIVVTVDNAAGKVIKTPEPVWLAFSPTTDGATATACCSSSATAVPLPTTPVALTTGEDEPAGEVVVTYTVAVTAPDSGSDVLTASPVPDLSAPGSASTSYQYSASPVPLTPPPSIADDCSVDVSTSLGPWLRNLPPNATVDPPANACYQVDEGLFLKFPVGLTIDGGTYESQSTRPGNSVRGFPIFNVLGGSNLTLENMTLQGANPGGYLAKMAFASGIQLQGTDFATVSDVSITDTFGDGITLDPLRSASDHEGPGIISATDNATISNVTITGPGRMGISFTSVGGLNVPGATVTNANISNVGLDTFDVEADQGDEGAQNVTIDQCTASTTGNGDFFADGGAGSGKDTGNITVSDCTMEEAQAGTALLIDRPGTGTTARGPFVFDSDTFECGSSTLVSCVDVIGGTATISNSALDFPGTTPAELAYEAATGTTLTFTDDSVTGYGTTTTGDPGTVDSTSSVTTSGGTWTPSP